MLQDSLISRVTIRLGVGEDDIRKLVRDAVAAKTRIEKAQTKRELVQQRRATENGPGPAPADAGATEAQDPFPVTEIQNARSASFAAVS